jgi:hypothetical protein
MAAINTPEIPVADAAYAFLPSFYPTGNNNFNTRKRRRVSNAMKEYVASASIFTEPTYNRTYNREGTRVYPTNDNVRRLESAYKHVQNVAAELAAEEAVVRRRIAATRAAAASSNAAASRSASTSDTGRSSAGAAAAAAPLPTPPGRPYHPGRNKHAPYGNALSKSIVGFKPRRTRHRRQN